jgi:hypothetical protein
MRSVVYSHVVDSGWLIKQLEDFSFLSFQVARLRQDSMNAEHEAFRRWRVDETKRAQSRASAAEARSLFEELRAREPTINVILELIGLQPLNYRTIDDVQAGLGDPALHALQYVQAIDEARKEGGQPKLADYLDLLDRCQRIARKDPAAANTDPVWAELRRKEPETKQILEVLGDDLADFDFDDADGLSEAREALVKGLAIFDGFDEIEKEMSSRTSEAPVLAADQFHPWVWEAARDLWDSGAYSAAVQKAARAINHHAQDRLDRYDVADTQLMREAFGDGDPEYGKPRLRYPGDQNDRTVKSRQSGARDYAVGCFQAIRNPASHDHREWDRQVAFESLAALSLLAQWIDDWELAVF